MKRMIIRSSILALALGIAAPTFAQDNSSGQSDEEILLNGGVVVNPGVTGDDSGSADQGPSGDNTVGEATPGIDGIPEAPLPRKRKQPGPDTNEVPRVDNPPPVIDDGQPVIGDGQPGIDGGQPDGEVKPHRRKRPPVVYDPGPETNGPTPSIDPIPEVDPDPIPHRRHPRSDDFEPGPGPDFAGPSAIEIERSLDARPRIRLRPSERVTIREFERRPDLRRAAPSIDIQAINFATGSTEIPISQYRKVENIATALERLLRRDPETLVLIEGHTDAVGSFASNQVLSERRAISLKRVLVREFGIPREALETAGYGEEYLLVPTSRENWRNRRVTLRAIDDFVR